MRIYIYSRKSVYTGKGESIENQIEMCKDYISAKIPGSDHAEIITYEDEGFSAKNTDRPHFQQMLHDIKIRKPDYVICYRLDRISRNVSDFSSLIENMNRSGISFICIREEFDTSKPMGKAMMYIASVFAQLERETIAERVRDNMLMLARTGRWLGGTCPTGFTSEKIQEIMIDGRIRTACRLKENPEEGNIIDCILEKFLELQSVSGVSKYLIKQGIRSRTGKVFSPLGIKDILQNPVYCIADEDARDYFIVNHADVCFEQTECSNTYGLLAYNKRDYRRKNVPRQGIDQWIIAIGKHKGHISGKKWVKIQTILKDRTPAGNRPAVIHNDYSLLSGLLFCSKCQSRMFAKQRSSNRKLFDYICNHKLHGGLNFCDCQNLNGQQTDDLICEALLSYAHKPSDICRLLEKLKLDLQKQTPKSPNPIAVIDDTIRKYNNEIDQLIHTLSHLQLEAPLIEHINFRISELDGQLTSLKEKRGRLQKHTSNGATNPIIPSNIKIFSTKLLDIRTVFHTLSIEEKRSFIRQLITKVVWDSSDLHIFINI